RSALARTEKRRFAPLKLAFEAVANGRKQLLRSAPAKSRAELSEFTICQAIRDFRGNCVSSFVVLPRKSTKRSSAVERLAPARFTLTRSVPLRSLPRRSLPSRFASERSE